MSVERVERKDGSVVWRVRWRQGGRNRSKVLGRKRDADAFEASRARRCRPTPVQWDAHILPRLGELSLRELTPDLVNRFRLELEADGVGPASIARSRMRPRCGS